MMVQANFLSAPDLLIFALIVLVLFGGKKIPELAKGLGEGIKNFKDATKEEPPVPKETPATPPAPTATATTASAETPEPKPTETTPAH